MHSWEQCPLDNVSNVQCPKDNVSTNLLSKGHDMNAYFSHDVRKERYIYIYINSFFLGKLNFPWKNIAELNLYQLSPQSGCFLHKSRRKDLRIWRKMSAEQLSSFLPSYVEVKEVAQLAERRLDGFLKGISQSPGMTCPYVASLFPSVRL